MPHTPTPEQMAIIGDVCEGKSLLVNALAGAAKTSTIEMASHALITQRPQTKALVLAFNVKIKDELVPRLPTSFKVQTLNACGHAAWGRVVGRLPLTGEKMANIRKRLDPQAPWELGKLVSMAKLNGLVPDQRQHMGSGILKDTRANWEAIADDLDIQLTRWDPKAKKDVDYLGLVRNMLVSSIDEAYKDCIDFDDQVYMSACFGGVFEKYDTIFVDEAQDLSPLNHLMLRRLAPKQMVCVGDPLQSIYAFRGADTQSMPKLQQEFGLEERVLSVCFRCSKAVADFAKTWAPHIQSPEWAKPGAVWQAPAQALGGDTFEWNFSELPQKITVLCRNNAPLIKLALKVFRHKRIAFINARAATAMLSSLRKILAYKKNLDLDMVIAKIEGWRTTKLDTEEPKKHERIMDEADALVYCAEAAQAEGKDYMGLEELISSLFQNKLADIWFGTGHGAKGLEWDYVLHLDPWRLPSKWAKSEEALQQEDNIHYVISTRAKLELYHANLDEYKEVR